MLDMLKSVLHVAFVMAVFCCCISCSSPSNNDLELAKNEVFDYLHESIPPEQVQRFRIADPELTGQEYAALKQYAKAKLILDKELLAKFEELGIGDMDILPKALADCFEDEIQDSSYNLKQHYQELMDRWIPIRDCRAQLKTTAQQYFKDYNQGDTITLIAPYYSTKNGYDIDIVEDFCGDKWKFDTMVDELYHGVLLNKRVTNSGKDYKFKVKVIYMNENPNRRSGNTIKLGDEIDFKVNSPMRVSDWKGIEVL